jgi:hypothetical protein
MHSNIVNDNGFFKTPLSINNDNDKYELTKRVEAIAYRLCEKLGSPTSFEFYCKVAYKMSEARIWSNYEKAQRGRNPARLFTWLCKREMASSRD